MATLVLHCAVFLLFLLWNRLIVEGSNSTVSFSNVSNPTASNGISNQLVPSNFTNTTISTIVVNSTHAPATHRSAGTTGNLSEAGIDLEARKSEAVQTTTATSAEGESGVQSKEPNTTEPFVIGNLGTDNKDDLPFWVYIIIVIAVILIVVAVVFILYGRVDRWKNHHGSYMVWDDNELELSPAFTRESEFLLDNLAANQDPGTPELQIYEIPLDSLGHQRVYIGTKRVAPKTEEHQERIQGAKFIKHKKHRKKDRHEFQDNTLPRAGRRDHIYSSVNDEASSTLSEGDLREWRNVNGHTLPAVILSSQNLHNSDPSKPIVNGSSSPEDFVKEIKSPTLGSRTKSVSNVFQNRPLPPAPSKRFSKSLDRLRFFDAMPHFKGKGKTFPHQKPTPIRAHPVLVKSSSFGGTFNKIVSASQPPVPAPRKRSLDLLDKSATFDVGHVRKSNLCHRHSKSLDTLLLLRDINWTAYDVDIYHSYASVHSNQSDNNNDKEPSYESVTSDENPSSHEDTSGRISSQSKASTLSGSAFDSDGPPQDDFNEENLYASVSEDEISKTGSLQSGCDPRCSNRESDERDSGAPSSILEAEDPASPYASVRISQIPGLVIRSSLGEESNCSEEVFEKEDSGSSIGTNKDLREGEDLKRASTHTYLELIPDSGRESIISETSSGYARPIDVLSNISEPSVNRDKDFNGERRKSLTDVEIPAGRSGTLTSSADADADNHFEQCPSVEYSSKKQESIPLVSDNSSSPPGSTDSTVQRNPRLSQLSNEGLEEDDDEDDDTRSELHKSSMPSEVHIYENTDFIENVRNRNAIEQLEAISSDVTNVKTIGLQEARLTDEFFV